MTDPVRAAGDDEYEAELCLTRLLRYIGDDPTREGLRDTPKRVLRAYREWFSGYGSTPTDLFRTFETGVAHVDEMILVSNVPVWASCEHHATPFFGLAHIAYIPQSRVLGLSKFARLVEVFARRLTIQERLTAQVADTLQTFLDPLGVGVVLECRHLCMESRGVRTRGTITSTSALRGVMRSKPEARAEFFSLVRGASKAREGI